MIKLLPFFFEFFQKTTPLILIICLTSLAVPSLISSASKLALVTFDWKQLETRCLAHFKDFFLLFWFSAVFGPLEVVIHINNYLNFCNCSENDFAVSETILSRKLRSFLDSENESDDSDDKFKTQNLYNLESESDNLDFICQNFHLITFQIIGKF